MFGGLLSLFSAEGIKSKAVAFAGGSVVSFAVSLATTQLGLEHEKEMRGAQIHAVREHVDANQKLNLEMFSVLKDSQKEIKDELKEANRHLRELEKNSRR